MIGGLLRSVSAVAVVIVAAGFVLFAVDEVGQGSRTTLERLEDPDRAAPSAQAERQREQRHGPVRETIEDANDVLLAPFADVTGGENLWAQRGVAALLGFLVYGFGLRLVANALPRERHREPVSWA